MHHRMQPGDVGDLAARAGDVGPALPLCERARFDAALLRRHAVRDEVAIGPGDAVPDGDFQPLGDELHPFDAYLIRVRRYFFPKSACTCLAWSRWVWIAGRTFSISPFSSAFCALG